MITKRRIIPEIFCLAGILCISHLCSAQPLIDKLKSQNQTSQFAQAISDVDLIDRFNGRGPFTLFAPSNEAFSKLSESQKRDKRLILNHILTGMATKRSLHAMSDITCLSGKHITIQKKRNGKISVNSYRIISSNIRANNGVIHIIDGVIK